MRLGAGTSVSKGCFATLLMLLWSCGGASTFDGARFAKRAVNYRVGTLPAGFERVKVGENDLAFHHPGGGVIGVHATCGGYEDVPPAVLLNHLLFGTTDRRYLVDEEVTVDGRGARHVLVDAELDGVPVRLDLYVLVRSGCVFDLTYVSDRTAPAARDFARFVHEFRIDAVHRG